MSVLQKVSKYGTDFFDYLYTNEVGVIYFITRLLFQD